MGGCSYDEDVGQGMYRTCSVLDFVNAKAPIELLAVWNAFKFDKGDETELEIVNDHEVRTVSAMCVS